MNELDFLREIAANPGDDAPRLIFADWLEEHGNPRGEFIRIDCRLARMSDIDLQRASLEGRRRLLLRTSYKGWIAPLRKYVEHCEFHRGMISRVKLKATAFLQHRKDLFKYHPITELHLLGAGKYVDDIARCTQLRNVTALDFAHSPLGMDDSGPSQPEVQPGANGRRWYINYRAWREQRERWRRDCAAVLAARLTTLLNSRYLKNLRWLGLRENFASAEGINAIVASRRFEQITGFDLRANLLSVKELATFTAARKKPVKELRLEFCKTSSYFDPLTAGPLPAAVAPLMPSLEHLEIGGCMMTLPGLRTLDEAGPGRLKTLNIPGSLIGNDMEEWASYVVEEPAPETIDLKSLADSALLDHLTSLELSSCYLQRKTLAPLLTRRVSELRTLNLHNNDLGDRGATLLAGCKHLANLVRLNLTGSPRLAHGRIEDAGLLSLAGGRLQQLRELVLAGHKFTDKGFKRALETGFFQRLTYLDLRRNNLGAAAANALIKMGPWEGLSCLNVRRNRFSNAHKARLREVFGNLILY